MRVYAKKGALKIDPQLVRFLYTKDPNKVPLISEDPISWSGREGADTRLP